MLKYFRGARTYQDILGVREHIKIFYGCEPLQRLETTGLIDAQSLWVAESRAFNEILNLIPGIRKIQ